MWPGRGVDLGPCGAEHALWLVRMACGPGGSGVPNEHNVFVVCLFFTVRGEGAVGDALIDGWERRNTLLVGAQCGCERVEMAFGRKILVLTRF